MTSPNHRWGEWVEEKWTAQYVTVALQVASNASPWRCCLSAAITVHMRTPPGSTPFV